jgi:NADPH:quinone reductase-like Zn-dependent oxidoreductase
MISENKLVQITSQGAKPALITSPIEKPRKNQVLVKMEYSPINPSDLWFIEGEGYPGSDKAPRNVGFEGSGVITEVGSDLTVPHNVGDRVALVSGGVWAKYCVVHAEYVFKLPDDISFEEGASHFVNPWTVEYMIHEIKKGGYKAVIHTAGASALGKMLIRRTQNEGIKLINLVRREGLVKELESYKPDYVINTEKADWEAELTKVSTETGATIAFDAIGGDTGSKVIAAIPQGSHLLNYGSLGGSTVTASVKSLIFEEKTVRGLYLTTWLRKLSGEEKQKVAQDVFKRLKDELKTDVNKAIPLEEFEKAIEHYKENRSTGKTLIKLN